MTEDYQSRLQQAWIGELQGEVYFEALAAHAEDAREKENWLALAELERRVGRVLEPIVDTSADISLESEGIVAAAKNVDITVPLVVRLEGTNVEAGKQILLESGVALTPADSLAQAAEFIVEQVKKSA